MISIGFRILGLAVFWKTIRTPSKSMRSAFSVLVSQGLFWYALPLVRGGLAARMAGSLGRVGITNLVTIAQQDNYLHSGTYYYSTHVHVIPT